MAHDLQMREPAKVITGLGEAIDNIKKIKGTVETTAQIGNMDLAIGGLDVTFRNLEQLTPSLDDAVKVFETTMESIEQHVATFQRNNQDITF